MPLIARMQWALQAAERTAMFPTIVAYMLAPRTSITLHTRQVFSATFCAAARRQHAPCCSLPAQGSQSSAANAPAHDQLQRCNTFRARGVSPSTRGAPAEDALHVVGGLHVVANHEEEGTVEAGEVLIKGARPRDGEEEVVEAHDEQMPDACGPVRDEAHE